MISVSQNVWGGGTYNDIVCSGTVCDPGWHPDEAGRLEAIMSFRELFFCLHNKMGMISVFTRVGRGGEDSEISSMCYPLLLVQILVTADLGDEPKRWKL